MIESYMNYIFSRNSSLRCQSKNCSRFWQLSTWLYHGAGRPIARKVHGSRFNLQLWPDRALFPRFHRQSTNQFFISSKRSCSILTDSSIKRRLLKSTRSPSNHCAGLRFQQFLKLVTFDQRVVIFCSLESKKAVNIIFAKIEVLANS